MSTIEQDDDPQQPRMQASIPKATKLWLPRRGFGHSADAIMLACPDVAIAKAAASEGITPAGLALARMHAA